MMRGEVSSKNKYYISKYRRLELKNFCLQYLEWEKEYVDLSMVAIPVTNRYIGRVRGSNLADPVAKIAMRKAELERKMQLVDLTAIEADEFLAKYIVLSVTRGYSYDYFYSSLEIPCGRDYFYERVRKFYWLLDKKTSVINISYNDKKGD